MALTPFQQAVSNLARSMGMKGEGEKAVYSTPEYQRLYDQYNPKPIQMSSVNATSPMQLSAEQDLTMQLIQALQNKFAQPNPTLDLSPFQGQLNDINTRLMAPATLPTLSQADLDNFNARKAAAVMANEEAFQRDQGKLIASLYDRGVQQSTVGNQAASDLLQGQGLVRAQTESDFATQLTAIQQALAQLQQGNLALAGQNTLGAGNMAVAGFTSQNDAIAQMLNQIIATLTNQQQVPIQRGNLELGLANLNENQRQSTLDMNERARQFDQQMEAQKQNLLKQLIGMGASLGAAFIPGAGPLISGGINSIFSKGPDNSAKARGITGG